MLLYTSVASQEGNTAGEENKKLTKTVDALKKVEGTIIGSIGKGKSRGTEITRLAELEQARQRLAQDGEERDVIWDLAKAINKGRLKAQTVLMDYISDTARNAMMEKTTSWLFREKVGTNAASRECCLM